MKPTLRLSTAVALFAGAFSMGVRAESPDSRFTPDNDSNKSGSPINFSFASDIVFENSAPPSGVRSNSLSAEETRVQADLQVTKAIKVYAAIMLHKMTLITDASSDPNSIDNQNINNLVRGGIEVTALKNDRFELTFTAAKDDVNLLQWLQGRLDMVKQDNPEYARFFREDKNQISLQGTDNILGLSAEVAFYTNEESELLSNGNFNDMGSVAAHVQKTFNDNIVLDVAGSTDGSTPETGNKRGYTGGAEVTFTSSDKKWLTQAGINYASNPDPSLGSHAYTAGNVGAGYNLTKKDTVTIQYVVVQNSVSQIDAGYRHKVNDNFSMALELRKGLTTGDGTFGEKMSLAVDAQITSGPSKAAPKPLIGSNG